VPNISALKLGANALMAHRAAIETTGHNIANIATPGYSRQRVEFNAMSPLRMTFGYLGRGADVAAVVRIADGFLEAQVRDAASSSAEASVVAEVYRNLEAAFNELSDYDISTAVADFFDALQDLAANVENEAARSAALQQGLTLRDLISDLHSDLAALRARFDEQIVGLADQVNALASQVAALNTEIVRAEAGLPQGSAADLRDRRGQLMRELSELVETRSIEQPGGAVNVTVSGAPLVFLGESFDLVTELESSRGQAVHTVRLSEGGVPVASGSGKLGGLIGARDEILTSYMDDLDEMVATFVWHFNRVHAGGVGERGLSGVRSQYAVANPADALSQADIAFDGPAGIFEIRNGSFTIYVRDEVSGTVSARNVSVDLDGIGTDTALLNSVTGNDLVSLINAAAPELTASVDSRGYLDIRSGSPNTTFHFGGDTSGVLATLGVNSFFTGFSAADMDVNSAIVADEALIATGHSLAAGDNTNVMELAALRTAEIFAGGTRPLEDFHQGVVSRLATEAAKSFTRASTRDSLLLRLENEREQISGVSLDEELTKLIQFQRTYQGAARFVGVVNDLLGTLLEI